MPFWKDKVVWITGASSGIGKELALQLATRNLHLILSARNEKALLEVAESCREKGSIASVLPLDMEKVDSLEKAAKAVIENPGKLDVFIHNAGISQRSWLKETHPDVDRRLMEVNYLGPVYLTKAILPFLLKQGHGHFVPVSSVVGKFGFPLRSGYSASKHAMQGFFESLRAELGKEGMKVTIVSPGRIKTELSLRAMDKDGQPYGKMSRGQVKGVPVEWCARKIIRGIENERKEVYIGAKESLMVYFRRYLPFVYYKLVSRVAAD